MNQAQIIAAVVFIGMAVLSQLSYWYGYQQGRNNGFHQGWRECQKAQKESK